MSVTASPLASARPCCGWEGATSPQSVSSAARPATHMACSIGIGVMSAPPASECFCAREPLVGESWRRPTSVRSETNRYFLPGVVLNPVAELCSRQPKRSPQRRREPVGANAIWPQESSFWKPPQKSLWSTVGHSHSVLAGQHKTPEE